MMGGGKCEHWFGDYTVPLLELCRRRHLHSQKQAYRAQGADRGWLRLPSLPAPPTITTQGFPVVGPQAVKAAKERMERERERSQRRRDVAKLTATSYYNADSAAR